MQRFSFDDTDYSDVPSPEKWEEQCKLAEAKALVEAKLDTQRFLIQKYAEEKKWRENQARYKELEEEEEARLEEVRHEEKVFAEKNREPNLENRTHAWNTPLSYAQIQALIALQVNHP